MERTLYNGLISGVALDGVTFFYENPLEATGLAAKDQRSPWFGVPCCPGNITRFMASVPGYVYAQRGDTLWVNLFAASTAGIKMDNGGPCVSRSRHVTHGTAPSKFPSRRTRPRP